MTHSYFIVSQIASDRGLAPRIISDLFYVRRLDDQLCPIIGGRRMIPADYLPELDRVLREAGILVERESSHAE